MMITHPLYRVQKHQACAATAIAASKSAKTHRVVRNLTARWFTALQMLLLIVIAGTANATTYYSDPVNGSMSNSGTSITSAWAGLIKIFPANGSGFKTFQPGDTLYCLSGSHGSPRIVAANTANVTIAAYTGADPMLYGISFTNSAANWTISGLDLCPAFSGTTYIPGENIVNITGGCQKITVENCTVRATLSIAGWQNIDWETNIAGGTAINISGSNCLVQNNNLTNVGFAIVSTGKYNTVQSNDVTNFYMDCFRLLGDNDTYQYNSGVNSFVVDSNHDDFLQSWTTGTDGVVGDGTISNVNIIGNYFSVQTDPNQPTPANGTQGIDNFDGMSYNFYVANNVIYTSAWHGISYYGAINCTIINNTVVEDPVSRSGSTFPWIMINEHKPLASGSAWPVLSSGNIVRNNIVRNGVILTATTAGIQDHNISTGTTNYNTYFNSWANFDVSLNPTSPAIGAGSTTDAPSTDILQRARTSPYDIGAYAFYPVPVITSATSAIGNVSAPFSYQITATNSPVSFGADNLPAGLGINTSTGIISGTPSASGTFPITIVATTSNDESGWGTLDLTVLNQICYDGFDYATGHVSSGSAGPDRIGFSGSWTGNNNVVSPGLTYPGLATIGNALQFSSNVASDLSVNMSVMPSGYTFVDSDGTTRLGAVGTELWFRFLLQTNVDDSTNTQTAALNLMGKPQGGITKLSAGITGTNGCWSITSGGKTVSSTIPIQTGTIVELVVRAQWVSGGGNDQVDLFVNPPAGANPPSTPSASLRSIDIGSFNGDGGFDRVEFKGNRKSTSDELSVATSWGSL